MLEMFDKVEFDFVVAACTDTVSRFAWQGLRHVFGHGEFPQACKLQEAVLLSRCDEHQQLCAAKSDETLGDHATRVVDSFFLLHGLSCVIAGNPYGYYGRADVASALRNAAKATLACPGVLSSLAVLLAKLDVDKWPELLN